MKVGLLMEVVDSYSVGLWAVTIGLWVQAFVYQIA